MPEQPTYLRREDARPCHPDHYKAPLIGQRPRRLQLRERTARNLVQSSPNGMWTRTDDAITVLAIPQFVVVQIGNGIRVKISSECKQYTDSPDSFTTLNTVRKIHGIGCINTIENCIIGLKSRCLLSSYEKLSAPLRLYAAKMHSSRPTETQCPPYWTSLSIWRLPHKSLKYPRMRPDAKERSINYSAVVALFVAAPTTLSSFANCASASVTAEYDKVFDPSVAEGISAATIAIAACVRVLAIRIAAGIAAPPIIAISIGARHGVGGDRWRGLLTFL